MCVPPPSSLVVRRAEESGTHDACKGGSAAPETDGPVPQETRDGSNKLPSFKVVDGRVPPDTRLFDFAGSTGLINGVPKTAGSFTFTVQVKDETGATDTETFTIEILPPEAPTITTEALSSGTVGEFYCCGNLFASGGVQPFAWSVVDGALPPGLELPRRENTISGTPTTAGTFTFTVRVTDDLGAFSEKEFSITIS